MNYPKRLIEVDLPIKRISAHARREKSIRHGHISTLHIWWARRPLAACRAVVCASLWPDPCDDNCQPLFTETAERLMRYCGENHLKKCSAESYPRFNKIARIQGFLDDRMELRKALLDFIADFANWDNSTDPGYLAVARTLTVASYDALEGIDAFTLPESISDKTLNEAIKDAPRPLLVDPFAGGGAIPLEGLRCGADAFASDLNPVAVLLNKIVLEYIPKYGQRLADEVEKWGKWIKEQAEKKLAEFYPKDEDGATPIAYLWARTIRCEGPGCGTTIPLIRNPQFSRKGDGWRFKIRTDGKKEIAIDIHHDKRQGSAPTVANGSAVCPIDTCGYTTPAKSVRTQLTYKNGGGRTARLLTVCVDDGKKRVFRDPNESDLRAIRSASLQIDLDSLPTDSINQTRPYKNTRGLSAVTRIGIKEFRDLYNDRQAISSQFFHRTVSSVNDEDWDDEFRLAVVTCLNSVASRLVFQNCTLSRWNASRDTIEGAFGKQALQNTWDFAESNPISDGPACWQGGLRWVLKVIRNGSCVTGNATAIRSRAQDQIIPNDMANVLITDPPYFAAIPYGDLSDVFYVWERHFIKAFYPELYVEGLTDKSDETIVTNANLGRGRKRKTARFYESEMTLALKYSRCATTPSGITVVVFADSTTESWESILGAVLDAGWQIVASWPIDTELQGRTQASNAASLQSSIHIVCRPREDEDGNIVERVGDWRDVLSELPGRIADWLPRLASEGVVGADAIFACLGPALEIFSRYSSVEKASGEVVSLREYLEQIWAEVARQALNMIFEGADASGFEEDARLTAMWLWTLRTALNSNHDGDEKGSKSKSLPGYSLEYDAARKIAQGLGAHLEKLSHLVEIKGNTAMLLSAGARTRYLFGKDAGEAPKKRKKKSRQQKFEFMLEVETLEAESGNWTGDLSGRPGSSVLDQLHQSMILFGAGRGEALKRFLVEEGIGKNPLFWRLAQALSALYPVGTDEKRWVDGVLARKKGLGF